VLLAYLRFEPERVDEGFVFFVVFDAVDERFSAECITMVYFAGLTCICLIRLAYLPTPKVIQQNVLLAPVALFGCPARHLYTDL
jgi:hypothetical protein